MNKFTAFMSNFYNSYIKFPCRIISHPIQGYTEFKEEKKAKMSVAIIMVLLAAIISILAYKYNGIIVNKNDPSKFNSLKIIIYTVSPLILLSVANWSITTLLDGKGKMKEIFMMGAYSYFPIIIAGLINLILSNVLTTEEASFITLIDFLGYFLMGYMLFWGLICIHEYGIGKAILTTFLTILATAVLLFIALLIFDLSQQIYGFFYSLYKEIVSRFF